VIVLIEAWEVMTKPFSLQDFAAISASTTMWPDALCKLATQFNHKDVIEATTPQTLGTFCRSTTKDR